MKRSLIKGLVTILSLALIVTTFAGCTPEDPEATTEPDDTTAVDETVEEARKPYASDELIEITWIHRDDEQDTINTDGQVWDDIAAITGVKINSVPLLRDVLEQRIQLAIAAGNLPELVQGYDNDLFTQYGIEGAFLPLDDLIEEHAPVIKEFLANPIHGEAEYWAKGLDGKTYVVPTLRPDLGLNHHFSVREDWINEYNDGEFPNNVEEFYEFLVTLKEEDPAGDGQTMPLMVLFSGHFLGSWFMLFDIMNTERETIFAEDGEIKFSPIDERYREGLQWINKFYEEGLIHQELFSLSEDAYYDYPYTGKAGVMHNANGRIRRANAALETNLPDNPDAKFVLLPPMESTNGYRRAYVGSTLTQPIAISNTGEKYAVELIKLLDWFFTDEAELLLSYGCVIDPDTGAVGTDVFELLSEPEERPVRLNPLVDDTTSAMIEYGWIDFVSPRRPHFMPHFDNIVIEGQPAEYDETTKAIQLLQQPEYFHIDIAENTVGTTFRFATFTPEEQNRINEITGPIETMIAEYKAKFIMGNKSLENDWDDYVDRLMGLGVEELLEIYTSGWNRYLGN